MQVSILYSLVRHTVLGISLILDKTLCKLSLILTLPSPQYNLYSSNKYITETYRVLAPNILKLIGAQTKTGFKCYLKGKEIQVGITSG